MSLTEIARFISQHDCFLVTSHARPDGDALGSELGLALGLHSAGKKVDVVNHDPHPSTYSELPGIERILISDRVPHLEYDAAFVLECGDMGRPELRGLEKLRVINIDHHITNQNFGEFNWNDTSAAAAGEMIYRLLRQAGIPVDARIATNLYVALFTDTGSFQYRGTTAQTLETAADLVRAGADPSFAARIIYNSNPYEKIRLLGMVLTTLRRDPSGRIAWIRLTQEMLRESGANKADTEGLVNYPLSIQEVQVVAFIREGGEGSFRVSLRSKGDVDVAAVAHRFGGGGHVNASGFELNGLYDEVLETVLQQLRPLVI
ncbi:MAG: bifunctional oligoribonuclease/PAP phosphatase NrnA [Acidobacteria bacterium]|nr:bifunctional oligoribonuclease/PAP phosphatase NrnA [Acidobacteriota bacterium]